MDSRHEITGLLAAWREGDAEAMQRLVALVYAELKGIAHNYRVGERDDEALNTTAIVHEAFLRLVDGSQVGWRDRGHFFAVASGVMRHVLVDYARRGRRAKRGGGARAVDLDSVVIPVDGRSDALLAIDDALGRLAAVDERLCRVVECRFFGGLSDEETAHALGVSTRTVRRDWAVAKGWLYRELEE